MTKIWRKSDFTKNVLTLLTGQALAQMFPILLAPILTRLYMPADYGMLDLVISIVSIVASVACGKYEQAIMLPEDETASYRLTLLSIFICCVVCVSLFVALGLFHSYWHTWLGISVGQTSYLYVIPFLVLGTGIFSALKYYNLKYNSYSLVAKSTAAKSITSVVVQLGLGFAKLGTIGLLVGQVASHLVSNFSLFKKIRSFRKQTKIQTRWDDLRELAGFYINFPKYSVAGTLANSMVLYLPSIFIARTFTIEQLGLLALTNRMLSMPLNLINASMGDAILQKMSRHVGSPQTIRHIFLRTLGILTLMVILPSIIGFIYLEDVFRFVFGENWATAGRLGTIMIPYFSMRFICSPLSNTLIVYQKQKLNLVLTTLQFILLMGCFVLALILEFDFTTYLWSYVLSQVLFYICYLYQCWNIVNNKANQT